VVLELAAALLETSDLISTLLNQRRHGQESMKVEENHLYLKRNTKPILKGLRVVTFIPVVGSITLSTLRTYRPACLSQ
jgi:hypothetical protein